MEQTAPSIPPITGTQAPLPKKGLIIIIGSIVLLVIILFSLYYFKIIKFKTASTSPPAGGSIASIPQSNEPAGLQKAKQLSIDYPQMVKRAFIQQQLQGTIKAASANSWTIEKDGKSLTLTNQTTNKIRFVKQAQSTNGSTKTLTAKEIKPEEVKPGDLVLIDQMTDWQSGQSVVTSITVLLPL